MDLDEMKAGWNVLNERLAQNEILNQRIIKEMITTRTKTAYEKVYHREWRDLILILVVGIIIIPLPMFKNITQLKWPSFILAEATMLLALLFSSWVIFHLSKFNLETSNINQLNRLVLEYKRYYGYSKTYGTVLGLSVVVIFMFLQNTYTNICAVITTIVMLIIGLSISFISLKKHEQSIREIEKGLDELKEFERE